MQNTGIPEPGSTCEMKDLDTIFIAANVTIGQEVKLAENNEHTLARFEMIEVFMRIAMVRIQSGDRVVMLGGLTWDGGGGNGG